jgi:osmotically-inducible protein OsmY
MNAMNRNLGVDAADVGVVVSGRAVTLVGTVSSVPARDAAHTVALSTAGVIEVQNRMVVRTPGGSGSG